MKNKKQNNKNMWYGTDIDWCGRTLQFTWHAAIIGRPAVQNNYHRPAWKMDEHTSTWAHTHTTIASSRRGWREEQQHSTSFERQILRLAAACICTQVDWNEILFWIHHGYEWHNKKVALATPPPCRFCSFFCCSCWCCFMSLWTCRNSPPFW